MNIKYASECLAQLLFLSTALFLSGSLLTGGTAAAQPLFPISGQHTAGGPDAIFFNPAALHGGGDAPRVTISLPGVQLQGGGGLLNIPVYNQYLTRDRVLTSALQQEMLNDWFPDGRGTTEQAAFDAGISGIGFSYTRERHAFALAQQWRAIGRVSASRGVLEAGFGGMNAQLFQEQTPIDARFFSAAFMQVGAAYSARLLRQEQSFFMNRPLEVYAGLAPVFLLGYQHFDADIRSTLQIGEDGLVRHGFNYEIRTHSRLARQLQDFAAAKAASGPRDNPSLTNFIDSPFSDFSEIAGYGFGLNAGVHAKVELPGTFLDARFFGAGPRELHLAFSATDFGNINFRDDATRVTHSGILEWRGLNLDDDWIDREFEGNTNNYVTYVLEDSLASDTYLSYDAAEVNSSRIELPGRLHFSSRLDVGRMSGQLHFIRGFNNTGLNSRRVAAGTRLGYRVARWLPLHAGFISGGEYGRQLEGGFGLRFRRFELDLSASTAVKAASYGSRAGFDLKSRLTF